MRKVAHLFAVVALTTCCFAANLTYVRIDEPIVEGRLALKPVDQAARLTMLRNQFLKAGCKADQIKEQHVPGQDQPDLICTLPGTEQGSIVIGARSDYQSKADEARVDWATLTMLPLLAESLALTPHRYSLVFIAFSGHKDLAGSTAYLKSLSDDERKSIRAMIDLDQIGRTPATYAFATVQTDPGTSHVGRRTISNTITHDDTPMSRLLPLAAATLKFSEPPDKSREQLVTDARNFERAGILALTITSPAYTTVIRPGNTVVPMARTDLDPKAYYQTYNLLCVYTLYLDSGIGPPRSRPATEVAGAATPATSAQPAPVSSANVASAASAPPVTLAASSTAPTPPAGVIPASQPIASTSAGVPSISKPATQNAEVPTPTFRSTTRLVQVDVVVTDKAGNPITGLKQEDFRVFQDGNPQAVRAFEAHVLTPSAATRKDQPRILPVLPPNTYTNLPLPTQDEAWTIVLYDTLNTAPSNQQNGRLALVDVLKSLPAGRPVALFVLGQRLEMRQGFTTETSELIRSAEQLEQRNAGLLTTTTEREKDVADINYLSTAGAGSGGSPAGNGRMLQTYTDSEDLRTRSRALFSIDAMSAMARAVSGYPGRKNLIWLSGSFPFQVEPEQGLVGGDPWRNSVDFVNRVKMASSLLASSRVAVYPIDIRGMQNTGIEASLSTAQSSNYVGAGSGTYGNTLIQHSGQLFNEKVPMAEIAFQTGGRAFVGTNNLAGAMKRAMADDSTYYTIAYTPPEQKEKREPYHKIELQLDRPGVILSYRRGYYAIPQKTTQAEGTAALQGALQPGMPPATMLYVMASVEPPKAKQKTTKINYIISPNNVTFSDLPENKKHVLVDCMAIAFDKDGKEVAHASDTLDGAIPQASYDAVMRQGLPANQELELKPGTYNLRLGVMDRATQQIGTVDVPLEITEQMAGK